MSQIRYRTLTERSSRRVPAPFHQKPAQDRQVGSNTQSNAELTDRQPVGERDEVAASAVLGYN